MINPDSILTIPPLPNTGGMSLFIVGYGMLFAGTTLVGAGLGAWKRLRGR